MHTPALATALNALNLALREKRLSEGDRRFGESLFSAAFRGRGLSEKQAEWVHKLVARASAPAPKPAAAPTTLAPTVAGVFALFTTARSKGLQHPKIRLETPDHQRVVLAQAGGKSRYAGQVMVTDGRPFGENTFFGRIDERGQLFASRAMTPAVHALLACLAANPAQVAKLYGQHTGNCCFCGRHLETAESVSSGYGPICAEKFGLPWERAEGFSGNSVEVSLDTIPEIPEELRDHEPNAEAPVARPTTTPVRRRPTPPVRRASAERRAYTITSPNAGALPF